MQRAVVFFALLSSWAAGQQNVQTFLGGLPTVTRWTTELTTVTRSVLPTCVIINPADNLLPCPLLARQARNFQLDQVQPSQIYNVEPTVSPAMSQGGQDPGVESSFPSTGEADQGEYRLYGLPNDCFQDVGTAKQLMGKNFVGLPTLVKIVSRTTTSTFTNTVTMPIIGRNLVGLRLGGCIPVDPPLPYPQCQVPF